MTIQLNDRDPVINYAMKTWGSVSLTVHLCFEELDQRLGERLDPFVHDVVALLCRVFVVQELNIFFLNQINKQLPR